MTKKYGRPEIKDRAKAKSKTVQVCMTPEELLEIESRVAASEFKKISHYLKAVIFAGDTQEIKTKRELVVALNKSARRLKELRAAMPDDPCWMGDRHFVKLAKLELKNVTDLLTKAFGGAA
ncbi:hypothetical protein [Allohahella marinimesophila]|uniref:hypothetical protein n=1 Tax=Allohahella marinimesophila TaxID=1054972 RepID=UPI0031D287F9